MIEACERRILEFPLDMDAREVAKELKLEGWYAWATEYASIVARIGRVRAKARTWQTARGHESDRGGKPGSKGSAERVIVLPGRSLTLSLTAQVTACSITET